jgi:hypothetical protein
MRAVVAVFLLVVGGGAFLRGFLLFRGTLPDSVTTIPITPPAKAVIVLIDALRYDFAAFVCAGIFSLGFFCFKRNFVA